MASTKFKLLVTGDATEAQCSNYVAKFCMHDFLEFPGLANSTD